MRQPVSLAHACRLVNHGPTVLVCSASGGRRNVMAAAWSMPVEFTPPRVAVVIDKSTYSRELITASGAFALCIPCRDQAALTARVGHISGRDIAAPDDKFVRFGIEHFAGPVLGLPLVAGCVGWLECRWLNEPRSEQLYDTFFGEVVSAQADDAVFAQGRWSMREDNAALHTIHHLGGGQFGVIGEVVHGEIAADGAIA
jgi:flavin reductase (DIM6/NTAB) family NADH-FMN oxidoreductase RutF